MNEVGLPLAELDTPILWVDLDQLQANIAHLAGVCRAAGVNWRPHTKGIKVPDIAHMALSAGASGITCAKLGEAEVMAAAGIRHILIANQIVGRHKIGRLVDLCRRADVIVAVDNPANVAEIGQAASAAGIDIGVLVEVNIGLERAGVQPGEPAVVLSRLAHGTPGIRCLGLMGWEGHAIAIPDQAAKRAVVERAVAGLADSARRCRAAGLPVSIVSAGGSGTYLITAGLPEVTEIQAGGAIFCDATYLSYGVATRPALFVRTMVTSRPTDRRVIFDAGFKALPAWHGGPIPVGLPPAEPYRPSAEHGTLVLLEANQDIKVGESYDFVLGYGDATVFLYDQLYGVRQGVVECIWDVVARGRLR